MATEGAACAARTLKDSEDCSGIEATAQVMPADPGPGRHRCPGYRAHNACRGPWGSPRWGRTPGLLGAGAKIAAMTVALRGRMCTARETVLRGPCGEFVAQCFGSAVSEFGAQGCRRPGSAGEDAGCDAAHRTLVPAHSTTSGTRPARCLASLESLSLLLLQTTRLTPLTSPQEPGTWQERMLRSGLGPGSEDTGW